MGVCVNRIGKVYSFARVGAALAMKVEDVYTQSRRLWLRLHEKGGKAHKMPCHHNLEEYLTAYSDGCGLRDDPKGPLFRTIPNLGGQLTRAAMAQPDAYQMIGRRARRPTWSCACSFSNTCATGVTRCSSAKCRRQDDRPLGIGGPTGDGQTGARAGVRFKVMRRMVAIQQSAEFQQMVTAKMSGEALFAFLDAHPNLRDRIASIVGAIEDSEGNLKEADAAEERIVEEM